MLQLGYAGVQMGTRFIATPECTASEAYKRALVAAHEDDVVLSERITGVPVAVLRTPYIQRMGLQANAFEKWMLRGPRTKHWMRTWFTLQAALNLRRSAYDEKAEFWQAGRSVAAHRRHRARGRHRARARRVRGGARLRRVMARAPPRSARDAVLRRRPALARARRRRVGAVARGRALGARAPAPIAVARSTTSVSAPSVSSTRPSARTISPRIAGPSRA